MTLPEISFSRKRNLLSVVLLLGLFSQVNCIGEHAALNLAITVAAPRPQCLASVNARPCPITRAAAFLDAVHLPSDGSCPCPALGDGSGAIAGAIGQKVEPNPEKDFFVDEVIANGFDNPVAMSFTDNSNELFVGTRNGIIWYVNLNTGEKKIFLDLSPEVGLSGDRGLMDLVTHPNYANVHQILVMYTVDDTPNDGIEPDAEAPANQRLVRLQDLGGGVHNPDFRLVLFGATPETGVPLCFNTHALGSMKFGLDGSLFVTTGEGAHWNFDMGDWGQDALLRFDEAGNPIPSLDSQCHLLFGESQDIGAWRAQSLQSLSGKLLRIAPDSGDGICPGSPTGQGYPVKNPYCDGTLGQSTASKVWARGLRNPFRLTVRPLLPGELYAGGPGVAYFGDVGQGGYEEINAVDQGGMNFGWPCWEGPLPSPLYRDSPYNDNVNTVFTKGCGGTALIDAPCGNITTVAMATPTDRWTCPFMYENVTTAMPFFYYSRFREDDNAGYFAEQAYTGQEIYGQTIAGLTFYTGSKYPEKYRNQLFALEFSQNWIRVLFREGSSDIYAKAQDFADLIFTPPANGAKVTLSSGPDGNVCYITMNGGEVRCFKYVVTNVAPTVGISSPESSGVAPVTIQFSSDGTFDRENDPFLLEWDFGDGSPTSSLANPSHLYVQPGEFTVTLKATDKFGNSGNSSMKVTTNNSRPKVTITSPIATTEQNGKIATFEANNQILTFDCTVEDDKPLNGLKYQWEFIIVHNNHIHPFAATFDQKTFSVAGNSLPNEGTLERNNLRLVLSVTDSEGLVGSDYIRLSSVGMTASFGNEGPLLQFGYNESYVPIQVGQPLKLDASLTYDPNGDRIDYRWIYGDGLFGKDVIVYHTYDSPGDKIVTLVATDNWGATSTTSLTVPIGQRLSLSPALLPPSSDRYSPFQIRMSTPQIGATLRYTTDGTEPSVTSTVFVPPAISVPFVVGTNLTVKVRSFVGGSEPSQTVTAVYSMLPAPCSKLGIAHDCSLVCLNSESIPLLRGSYNETIPAGKNQQNTIDPPINNFRVRRYLIDRIYGIYDPELNSTSVHVFADGGDTPGQAIQARVSYDWTNDGTWDRIESFSLLAMDPQPEKYEEYSHSSYNLKFPNPAMIKGNSNYMTLNNGSVRLELWQALGSGIPEIKFRTDGPFESENAIELSNIVIPYKSAYQSGPPSSCNLRCNGPNFFVDECGTCNGGGATGCDSTCFSTKVLDSCGVCGGVGVTGCDRKCNSTLKVSSCGVCGGTDTCNQPEGTYRCDLLGIRSECGDLLCNTLLYSPTGNATVPSPLLPPIGQNVPTDPALVLRFLIKNVTGFYNVDEEFTRIVIHADAGNKPGTALFTRVSYDWTGDGVFDRIELYDLIPPNDLSGYEKFEMLGTSAPKGKLIGIMPTEWNSMESGTVRIEFWQAFASNQSIFIKTDSTSDLSHSLIKIPFVTAWRENSEGDQLALPQCGRVTVPATSGIAVTTRGLTTGYDDVILPMRTTGITGSGSSSPFITDSSDSSDSSFYPPTVTSGISVTSTGGSTSTNSTSTSRAVTTSRTPSTSGNSQTTQLDVLSNSSTSLGSKGERILGIFLAPFLLFSSLLLFFF
eukprot:TRINITY_DN4399_c0_g1_i3.p1 TRINITY_DN4399_c0_g1~~TRINITY_DN4399_c0_g1_i3.p1  ORF type:complete len:1600 (-),score=362.71 TRINITY_DN4399_c0_g1_i3:1191-5990(-)